MRFPRPPCVELSTFHALSVNFCPSWPQKACVFLCANLSLASSWFSFRTTRKAVRCPRAVLRLPCPVTCNMSLRRFRIGEAKGRIFGDGVTLEKERGGVRLFWRRVFDWWLCRGAHVSEEPSFNGGTFVWGGRKKMVSVGKFKVQRLCRRKMCALSRALVGSLRLGSKDSSF